MSRDLRLQPEACSSFSRRADLTRLSLGEGRAEPASVASFVDQATIAGSVVRPVRPKPRAAGDGRQGSNALTTGSSM